MVECSHRFATRTVSALGVNRRERECSKCGQVERFMRGQWTRIRKARPVA